MLLHSILFALGIALSVSLSTSLLLTRLFPFIKKSILQKNMSTPAYMSHWLTKVDLHLRKRKTRLKAGIYIGLIIFAINIGIFAGTLLKNPLAAILVAAIGFIIPEQIFLYLSLRSRLKKFDQLVEACPLFAVELERVNATRALGNVGRSVPDPVGRIFRQAERNLISAGNPQEAFGKMYMGLDFLYGRDFVSRATDCYYNAAVAPMIVDLGREMAEKRKRLHENVAKLFTDRMYSMFIIAMFFPAYAISAWITPTAWEFLTTTIAGKLMICVYLSSIIIGPMVDYTTIKRLEV